MGLKEGAGLDLEHLSLLACNGVNSGCSLFLRDAFRRSSERHCFRFLASRNSRALLDCIATVDDRRRLRRHHCGRYRVLGTASARRRVRRTIFYGRACRIDLAHCNPSNRARGRTAKDVIEHHWLYLHRLDVWTSGFSGERHQRLWISLLYYFRDANPMTSYVFTFGGSLGALRSEISPNKTWEGALGALAVSMVLPGVAISCFHFSARYN